MRYFPIFVDLQDKPVLVAGGGEKAAQKLRLLARTPAKITVVAARVSAEVTAVARGHGMSLKLKIFAAEDLDGVALVFAANDDPDLDEAVAAAARARSIPVNVVDGPDDSSFIMPAMVDRAPVVVAIGTEGAAPVLARDIRAKIESLLPADVGAVAARAGELRARIRSQIALPAARRRVWEHLLSGLWRDRVAAGDGPGAEREVSNAIADALRGALTPGRVSLIGCGPGDPDLLTLKAHRRLHEADVLVIDRLVDTAVLDYARRDARRIWVGKEPGGPSASQQDINRILITEALKGGRVARLKGGDPFVFGRAAEEMQVLQAAGIEVEVIPGVTAALACAAAIGLPVTLRGKLRQFSLLTGATADRDPDLDWSALSEPGQAFAVYMGVRSAPMLRRRLLAAGAAPATPVVIVENATRTNQRAIATTLDRLGAAIRAKSVQGPAVLFVGLSWEEARLTPPAHVERFEGRAESARAADEPSWTPALVANATHWVVG